MLVGFSIGHWIGGKVAERFPDRRGGLTALCFLLGLAAMSAAASVIAFDVAAGLPRFFGGVRLTTVLFLTAALFLPPSIAAGTSSPLATSIAVEEAGPARQTGVLSLMFAAAAGGAILGVVGTGFALVPLTEHFHHDLGIAAGRGQGGTAVTQLLT